MENESLISELSALIDEINIVSWFWSHKQIQHSGTRHMQFCNNTSNLSLTKHPVVMHTVTIQCLNFKLIVNAVL